MHLLDRGEDARMQRNKNETNEFWKHFKLIVRVQFETNQMKNDKLLENDDDEKKFNLLI